MSIASGQKVVFDKSYFLVYISSMTDLNHNSTQPHQNKLQANIKLIDFIFQTISILSIISFITIVLTAFKDDSSSVGIGFGIAFFTVMIAKFSLIPFSYYVYSSLNKHKHNLISQINYTSITLLIGAIFYGSLYILSMPSLQNIYLPLSSLYYFVDSALSSLSLLLIIPTYIMCIVKLRNKL